MAIFPIAPISGVDPTTAVDVEAWTVEQAAQALRVSTISSSPPVRGTTVTIDIPLDAQLPADEQPRPTPARREAVHTVYSRRTPVRRDSLKRREALLKGKEGSRRRQRWENDRLLNNPYAEPPLPSDWEVRPTYPVHSVPYFLAPLWDAEFKAKAKARQAENAKRADPLAHGTPKEQTANRVAKELRAKLKKSRGAKGLLQDLEEEVRSFIAQWEAKQQQLEREGLIDGDSEDEEIVFVGRNGNMRDSEERRREKEEEGLAKDKLIFQSLVDDHGAAFGRWLVHSIAAYYGLETWSITTGDPARREAYIGLRTGDAPRSPSRVEMPRPLWGLV